jgi:hypothetical protein
MRKLRKIPVLFVLFMVSCQYIDHAPTKQELLQQELKSIDWNEVDALPSVPGCDTLTDIALQKNCFFEYLSREVQLRLDPQSLAIYYPERDTIEVKVTVFPDTTLKFEPQFAKDTIAYDTAKIDSILAARLADFPKINPAVKRGVPVKSQFILPVILKGKD